MARPPQSGRDAPHKHGAPTQDGEARPHKNGAPGPNWGGAPAQSNSAPRQDGVARPTQETHETKVEGDRGETARTRAGRAARAGYTNSCVKKTILTRLGESRRARAPERQRELSETIERQRGAISSASSHYQEGRSEKL